MSTTDKPVIEWQRADVEEWFRSNQLQKETFFASRIRDSIKNGKILLIISPSDVSMFMTALNCADLDFAKEFQLAQRKLQLDNLDSFIELGYDPATFLKDLPPSALSSSHGFQRCSSPCSNQVTRPENLNYQYDRRTEDDNLLDEKTDVNCRLDKEHQRCTHHPPSDGSDGEAAPTGIAGIQALFTPHTGGHPGLAKSLPPEVWKAVVAMAYLFIVTWITAFVMVIVHDRVPDMKKYPPLPDIFLDNVPHIPWAFHMCEVTGTILLIVWIGVLLFHKHRFILLRRFFALSGTVFLLRCVTMLITSLSVPGSHLQCNPRTTVIGNDSQPYGDIWAKAHQAYLIWKGAGMSIQGVRTCGDYMFSGHTVALTMLNFFITEYTPRHLYFIHTFTWLLNMFGIFFILSAHEHYSIDVFVAFYITSRLFLYYHTLASHHRSLMRRDTGRTRIWFPLLAFFEASVDGTVPNEYEWPTLSSLLPGIPVSAIKDKVILTVAQCMVWKNTGDSTVPDSANQLSHSHTVGRKEMLSKTTKTEKVS